jgi:tetratricopeptide (TPR) repeat protein
VVGLDVTSPAQRAANGAIAAVLYLVKWVWPAGLAVHYPWHPPSAAAAAASLLLLAALGAGALALRRRAPWVAAGLAWYLVALVPVIGLVQVGNQAMADRYTYLALIGPAFAVAWTLESVARRGAAERRAAAAASLAVAAVLAVLTVRQTMVWKDSITLWRHTLAVTEDNAKAHVSLGKELIATGRQREGAEQLRAALVVDPGHADAANDLAVIAYAEGRHGDALALWKIALARRPTDPGILSNIGLGHAARSEWEAAAGSFAESLARRPDHGDTLVGLGVARAALGELGEAERFLRRAAKVNPRSVLAWDHLGRVLSLQGDCGGAADAWRQALAVEPGDRWAQRSLAWLLATSPDARCRDARKALVLAGELASSGAADDLEVLAAAHAAQGAYDQAVAAQQRAVDAAPPGPGREQALARLDAYRGGRSPAASGPH